MGGSRKESLADNLSSLVSKSGNSSLENIVINVMVQLFLFSWQALFHILRLEVSSWSCPHVHDVDKLQDRSEQVYTCVLTTSTVSLIHVRQKMDLTNNITLSNTPRRMLTAHTITRSYCNSMTPGRNTNSDMPITSHLHCLYQPSVSSRPRQ